MKIIYYHIIVFSFVSVINGMQLEVKYAYSLRENGKGWREKDGSIFRRQEDTVACVSKQKYELYCLFDGHGGNAISEWLKNNFIENCERCSVKKIPIKLHAIFKYLDDNIPSGDKYDYAGSTALIAHIKHKKNEQHILTIAHAGDSRAVLEENNEVAFETVDHNCNNAKERERIEGLGGEITNGSSGLRVEGIEPTRAFGDKALRKNLIIPVPDVSEIILTPKNNFLILASDGVWNKISSKEAIEIVTEAMALSIEELRAKYPDNPKVQYNQLADELDEIEEGSNGESNQHLILVARALCYEAVNRGSTDNISAIIAKLLWHNVKKVEVNNEATHFQEAKTIPVECKIVDETKSYNYGCVIGGCIGTILLIFLMRYCYKN